MPVSGEYGAVEDPAAQDTTGGGDDGGAEATVLVLGHAVAGDLVAGDVVGDRPAFIRCWSGD